MENEDLIIFNKETREIIAIVPIVAGKRSAVCKKGYDLVISDCNKKNIIGNGKNIFLAKD